MADTPTVDRSGQLLIVVAKSDTTKVLFKGKAGDSSVTITGVAAGTAVKSGDYQVAYQTSDGSATSTFVDVPAFTVPIPAPDAPTNVAAKATADGADVTAK